MAIVFSDITTYKSFDNDHLYRTRVQKMKDHDGPNHLTILFSQLIIMWLNRVRGIDTSSNIRKDDHISSIVDKDILKIYSSRITEALNDIIWRLEMTDKRTLSLPYNKFRLTKTDAMCKDLNELKEILDRIQEEPIY